MKMIIGLGNPTNNYHNTRHNAGFMALDFLAREKNCPIYKAKFNGEYTTYTHNNEKVILLKPLLYMNLSGIPILEYMNYFDLNLEDILILVDDMDLPFNHLRLRFKGNAGGHNGIKNVIEELKSTEFCRVRIGIDRPEFDNDVDYVLSKFAKSEIKALEESFKDIVHIVDLFVENKFIDAMNKYNKGQKNEDN